MAARSNEYPCKRKGDDREILDLDQMVVIKWNVSNRHWFEERGYLYTKRLDEFCASVRDLMPSSQVKIKAICDRCGNAYTVPYVEYQKCRKRRNSDYCADCGRLNSGVKKGGSMRTNEQIREAVLSTCAKFGYQLIAPITAETKVSDYVEYECPKHGVQRQRVESLSYGHKCRKCAYEEMGRRKKRSPELVAQSIASKNGNILLNPEDYKSPLSHNLRIRCGLCGQEFRTSFQNYMRVGIDRCRSCSQKESSGEVHVRHILERHGIAFEPEKRFDECKDKRALPFDFYLPEYNLCIEFDGQGHYGPKAYGETSYQTRIKHDAMKDRFCSTHGVSLLRIPYYAAREAENMIISKISEIKKHG